jgi:hypothetical protein
MNRWEDARKTLGDAEGALRWCAALAATLAGAKKLREVQLLSRTDISIRDERCIYCLQRRDVRRLQTLRALLGFEADLLVFSEGLEAFASDLGEMREEVVTALVRSLNHLTVPVSMRIP